MKYARELSISSAVILGVTLGIVMQGCSKKEDTNPRTDVVAEMIHTSGVAPNLFVTCWRGMTFITIGEHGGILQVMNEEGKPMKCEK